MWNFKKEMFKSYSSAIVPIISCQCFDLTSFTVNPEETTTFGTTFRYTDCESNSIVNVFVSNNTSTKVCGKKVSILSGDPGSITISETDCCILP